MEIVDFHFVPGKSRGGVNPKGGGLNSFDGAEVSTDESGNGICAKDVFGPGGPGFNIGKPGAMTKTFEINGRSSKSVSIGLKFAHLRPAKGGGSRLTICCCDMSKPGGGTPKGGMKFPPSTPTGANNPVKKQYCYDTRNII